MPLTQFTPDARQRRAAEIVARSDHDLRRLGLDRQHVERLGRRQAQALALADREAMHAGVRAEHAAVVVDHRAGPRRLRRLALDERRVVAVGHEADLLAVGLLRHVQLQAAPRARAPCACRDARRETPRATAAPASAKTGSRSGPSNCRRRDTGDSARPRRARCARSARSPAARRRRPSRDRAARRTSGRCCSASRESACGPCTYSRTKFEMTCSPNCDSKLTM